MANQFLYANFFATELIASVGVGDTILQIPPTAAQQLQNFSSGFYAPMSLWDGSNPPEIVYVVNNPQTGALTVLRAQEGTSAFGWSAGTQMISSLTAGVINAALQAYNTGLILIANYLPLSGGTLTGPLFLASPPTVPNQAASKAYVDALGTGPFLPLSGGTLTGDVSMNTHRLLALPAPTTGSEPATKTYADAISSALTTYKGNVSGAYITGGTGAAYTVSTTGSQFSGGLTDGTKLAFRLNATSQTAPTLAVDGTAAVALRIQTGVNLQASALATGLIIVAEYRAAGPEWLIHELVPPQFITTTGGTLAYSVTTNLALSVLQDGVLLDIIINTANTGATTLNVDGLGAVPLRPSSGVDYASGALAQYTSLRVRYNSITTEWIVQGAPQGLTTVGNLPFAPINLQVNATVASNQLTVAIKTANTGADPSITNPVRIPFPDNTVTGGDPVWVSITSALSITTTVGGTFGVANNIPFRLRLVAINNGGTAQLGLINNSLQNTPGVVQIFPLNEDINISPTTIGAGSTSAGVFYSTSNPANVAFKTIALLDYETGLATAGTFNNPPTRTRLVGPGTRKPGDVVQSSHMTTTTATTSTANSTTKANTALSLTVTPSSPINTFKIGAEGTLTTVVGGTLTASGCLASLFRGTNATLIGGTSAGGYNPGNNANIWAPGTSRCFAWDAPQTGSAVTYGHTVWTPTAIATQSASFLSAGSGGNSATLGTQTGTMTVDEIMM